MLGQAATVMEIAISILGYSFLIINAYTISGVYMNK